MDFLRKGRQRRPGKKLDAWAMRFEEQKTALQAIFEGFKREARQTPGTLWINILALRMSIFKAGDRDKAGLFLP
ncbi:MAG: hypothetical protein LBB77_09465 [Treponema sp.]|jgi:hypothetical protein|nr:hypothetical protein [Treponema sp.]